MNTTTGKIANSIEALENRIAPAGVVTVTLQAGVLTVNGDAEDNQLLISAGLNGQIFIEPSDDTDVGAGVGVPRVLTGSVKSIVSNLGSGDDALGIADFRSVARISVTGGIGDDLIQLSDVAVSGGVTVDLGIGDDGLEFGGTSVGIGGNLVIQGGEGDNTFSFSALRVIVRGTLAVSAGSGTDAFQSTSTDLQILKSATLALGEDQNIIALADNTHTQVRGNLLITGGEGRDGVGLGPGASLSVRGNLTFDLGNGQNSILEDETAIITVGGTLRATGGIGIDTFNLGGLSLTARDVVLDSGDGLNTIRFGGAGVTARNITISGGADSDTITVPASNLTVTGRLLVNGGDGSDAISIQSENFLVRSATFLGGNGTDNVEILGDGRFSGAVLVDVGTGGATFDPESINIEGLVSGLAFGSSLTVRSTGGADSADNLVLRNAEIRGKTDIQLGDGASLVSVDDVYLRNSLLLDTNGGNDSIQIELSDLFPLFPSDSLALKSVTIRAGAGDDNVQIGTGTAGQRVDFRGKLSVFGEEGTDTINDVTNANLFRPGIPPLITGFENVVS